MKVENMTSSRGNKGQNTSQNRQRRVYPDRFELMKNPVVKEYLITEILTNRPYKAGK